MVVFSEHKPVGERASWQYGRDPSTLAVVNEFQALDSCQREIRLLRENTLDPRLPRSQAVQLMVRLHEIIGHVRKGCVRFDEPYPEATIMVRRPHVYELRPQMRSRLDRPTRELRLYCAEPAQDPGVVLGLHLATKPAGPDPTGEQNMAVEEASERADGWTKARIDESTAR